MEKERYWITVVSKDHIQKGVEGGFMQANHGKPGPLKKLRVNDWVIFYSPKVTYQGDEKLHAFTAIGQVRGEEIYQYRMEEDFTPFRRHMTYYPAKDAPIVPLIGSLDFVRDKKSWGFRFRFGFFEIDEHDFNLLKAKMFVNKMDGEQFITKTIQQ